MTRTGVFIKPDELDAVRIEQQCSGMCLSGGAPMSDPGAEVERLRKKYNLPRGTGLDTRNGEFVSA